MGTNVYFYKKIDEDIKQRIIEDLKFCDNIQKMQDLLTTFSEEHPEYNTIHIGKRSGGWKFLFAREILRFCKPNKESILNWLSTGVIINEYDEILTPEEFWKDYIEDFQDGVNQKEYYIKYPEEKKYFQEIIDEMINGLRFTNKEYEFS